MQRNVFCGFLWELFVSSQGPEIDLGYDNDRKEGPVLHNKAISTVIMSH
jgi:hypothetical protein